MSHIEWRREARRIVLPIAVLRPNTGLDLDFIRGRGLIDTGATNSGITPRIVRELALDGQGKRPMNGVHGEHQTERYIFRIGVFADDSSGQASALPFVFDEVDGIGMQDSFQFDVLVGMDILRQCDFEMKRSGSCRLTFGQSPNNT